VLLGDAVYLITSADPALLAAAAETISERDRRWYAAHAMDSHPA
jgi:hypothetical protein